MDTLVRNAFNLICAGVLPVLIMIAVVAFAVYMALYDFIRERVINLNRIAGLIGGLVAFSFVTLVLSSPSVQGVLNFQIDPLVSLVSAIICMGPAGLGLGLMSSYLAKTAYSKDYFSIILGAWAAGGLTALYAYATSEASFRFMLAGLSLGFLFGVTAFVIPNAEEIVRILKGLPPKDSGPGSTTTVHDATVT